MIKDIIYNAIDWTSVKLSIFPLLGIFAGSTLLQVLSGIGVLSTVIYNGIRIYKELKNKNNL